MNKYLKKNTKGKWKTIYAGKTNLKTLGKIREKKFIRWVGYRYEFKFYHVETRRTFEPNVHNITKRLYICLILGMHQV